MPKILHSELGEGAYQAESSQASLGLVCGCHWGDKWAYCQDLGGPLVHKLTNELPMPFPQGQDSKGLKKCKVCIFKKSLPSNVKSPPSRRKHEVNILVP